MMKYPCGRIIKEEPEGYVQWQEWAQKRSKTHRQIKCKRCGLYHIWLPKKKKIKEN